MDLRPNAFTYSAAISAGENGYTPNRHGPGPERELRALRPKEITYRAAPSAGEKGYKPHKVISQQGHKSASRDAGPRPGARRDRQKRIGENCTWAKARRTSEA